MRFYRIHTITSHFYFYFVSTRVLRVVLKVSTVQRVYLCNTYQGVHELSKIACPGHSREQAASNGLNACRETASNGTRTNDLTEVCNKEDVAVQLLFLNTLVSNALLLLLQ